MTSSPLRLRVQKVERGDGTPSTQLPVARLWVDTGLSHLEPTYDYLVPQSLDADVSVGVKVLVDFAGRKVDGFVIERIDSSSVGNLKFIEKVTSPVPLLTAEIMELVAAVARRWGSIPSEILTAAIPPRVMATEKGFTRESAAHLQDRSRSKNPSHSYYLFTPGENPFETIASWAVTRLSKGGVLLVLPELREVLTLAEELSNLNVEFVILDGSLPRSTRYENFLKVATGAAKLVIGTRSAIFAPVANLQTIVVFREGSESHYEKRSPGWNVRDVSILRSQLSAIDLTFAGFAPSSEVSLLIEDEAIALRGKRAKVNAIAYPQKHGELLPDRIFTPIRDALTRGSVLFLVPRKGYSQAISCTSCRNISLCDCGGRIYFSGPEKGYICSLCNLSTLEWSCKWCKKSAANLLGRGNLRFAQEIGRAFPGFPVLSSDATHVVEQVENQRSIVLATAGMAPPVEGGYQAVVVLEGDNLFSQLDLRAQERAREAIMQSASLLSANGKALIVVDNAHPIVAGLSRWNLSPLLTRELRERAQTQLPPYVHAIVLEIASSESSTFLSGIRSSISDSRLPSSTRILGPTALDSEFSRIILTISRDQGQELFDFLVTYRKKRGLAKKSIPRMRIDPYVLSHSL
jgi:primosomal protein N' (replication factor Y) (superfamily II helicase)